MVQKQEEYGSFFEANAPGVYVSGGPGTGLLVLVAYLIETHLCLKRIVSVNPFVPKSSRNKHATF